ILYVFFNIIDFIILNNNVQDLNLDIIVKVPAIDYMGMFEMILGFTSIFFIMEWLSIKQNRSFIKKRE
ncbi:MAG: hypothetical protein JW956_14040, partial [Calditrichaceae bacterium]|nr:hypothetical protein [Calditrichaceae bacterium]